MQSHAHVHPITVQVRLYCLVISPYRSQPRTRHQSAMLHAECADCQRKYQHINPFHTPVDRSQSAVSHHTVQDEWDNEQSERPLPWPRGANTCKLRAVVTGRRRISKRLVFVDLVPLSSVACSDDGGMPERTSWTHPDTGQPCRCCPQTVPGPS